jgi:hypothetical protein
MDRVAEPPGHGSQVDASGQELGGDVVAQVVQAQIVETDPMAQGPEGSAGRVGSPGTATVGVVAEHEASAAKATPLSAAAFSAWCLRVVKASDVTGSRATRRDWRDLVGARTHTPSTMMTARVT